MKVLTLLLSLSLSSMAFAEKLEVLNKPLPSKQLFDLRRQIELKLLNDFEGLSELRMEYYTVSGPKPTHERFAKMVIKDECWGECKDEQIFERFKIEMFEGNVTSSSMSEVVVTFLDAKLLKIINSLSAKNVKLANFHYSDGSESLETGFILMWDGWSAGEPRYLLKISELQSN